MNHVVSLQKYGAWMFTSLHGKVHGDSQGSREAGASAEGEQSKQKRRGKKAKIRYIVPLMQNLSMSKYNDVKASYECQTKLRESSIRAPFLTYNADTTGIPEWLLHAKICQHVALQESDKTPFSMC